MKIMDSFGAGGIFTEYYAMDFNDDVVLWVTMDRATSQSPRAKPRCRPLQVYHGKVGHGLVR